MTLAPALLACLGIVQQVPHYARTEPPRSAVETVSDARAVCWTGWIPQEEPDPLWRQWWWWNRDRFRDTRTRIYASPQREHAPAETELVPTDADVDGIRELLLAVLAERGAPLLQGAVLDALARVGDARDEPGRILPRILPFLAHDDARLQEDAVIALAILRDTGGAPELAALVDDAVRGHELVGTASVPSRMRALAAYALARIGATSEVESVSLAAAACLSRALADRADLDLEVAAVHGLGLLPLAREGESEVLALLSAILVDPERAPYARGQAALALAHRLRELSGADAASWKERAAASVLAHVDAADAPLPLRRQAALALGVLAGDAGEHELRARIAAGLRAAARAPDELLAGYSLLACASLPAALAAAEEEEAAGHAAFLIVALDGRPELRPWAALACGWMGWTLPQPRGGPRFPVVLAKLRAAVRERMTKAAPEQEALVIATGLLRDPASRPWLIECLGAAKIDALAGEAATALGSLELGSESPATLADLGRARSALRAFQPRARRFPDVHLRACEARWDVGDPALVSDLLVELQEASGLAQRVQALDALSGCHARRVIEPIAALLRDTTATAHDRAWGAWALGELANKENTRWNALLARDVDRVEAPATLHEGATGRGILDYR